MFLTSVTFQLSQVNFGIETIVPSCLSFSTVAFSALLSSDPLAPGTVIATPSLPYGTVLEDKFETYRLLMYVVTVFITWC